MRRHSFKWPARFTALAAAPVFALLAAAQSERPVRPVTTEEIVVMLEAEISEDLIHTKISADGCECLLSPQLIAQLQEAGASDEMVSGLIGRAAEVSPENYLTTEAIIEMLDLEIPEGFVWQFVHATGCNCDTSAQSIIDLKRAGASDELVGGLIEFAAESREPAGP